jgi:putative aminopeptidase FrvX
MALAEMLRYRRPHGSKSERRFINRFLRPLGCESDDEGNLYLAVGDDPKILWSAHTDSVHRNPGKQKIVMRENKIKLASTESISNCLGADNAAGVWILTEMIRAKVPGLYVFHRQEESGGIGSQYFASTHTKMLAGMQAAIAFDRRRTKSIITHQWGGRTASDAFAKSLALHLGLDHKPDDGGTFTDTASYSEIIPECTNVSVGFENEHSAAETLDLPYLLDLRQAMVGFNQDQIVIERDPSVIEPQFGRYGGYATTSLSYGHRGYERLKSLCERYPGDVADFLEMVGIDPDEIEEHIASSYSYASYAREYDSV